MQEDACFRYCSSGGSACSCAGPGPGRIRWLALNFHVLNTKSLDFWVAPQIAYVAWNNPLEFSDPSVPGQATYEVATDSEFPGIGLALGLDYWLSERNGLNFAFRFVDADANENLPVDPTFITVGYTRKF